MIYLDNVTTAQKIAFPLYATPQSTTYDLAIKRNTTGYEYVTVSTTYVSKNRLYVYLSVTLTSGMANGEYEYRLRESGNIVGGGILVISGASYADVQHEQQITYKEYESNQI